MARLNKYIKDSIISELRNKLTKANTEIPARKDAFFLKVYRHFVPEHIEAKMKSLPDGYFSSVNGVAFYDHTGSWHNFDKLSYTLLAPAFLGKNYGRLNAASELSAELKMEGALIASAENDLRRCIREITENIKGILEACNTTKQLLEAWPEAAAYLPSAPPPATPNLPAIPIRETQDLINQMLGVTE